MDFKELIKYFVNEQSDSKIGYYMIHLERATERIELINDLNNKLNTTIPIFPGADGAVLLKEGHPNLCAHTEGKNTRGPGDIGCTVSHVRIFKEALEKGLNYAVVFEDDCVLNTSYDEFLYYIENTKKIFDNNTVNWDLFLLGNNAHINNFYKVSPLHVKVDDFYGTTAYIINKKMMYEIVSLYNETLLKGQVHSADGLFSIVLRSKLLNAYACIESEHFFIQKKGLYSYILEGVRI